MSPPVLWFILLCLFLNINTQAQTDSLKRSFSWESDFRFRIEHDWDSQDENGNLRTDRTRFRLRARFGANYQLNSWAKIGARIRTGNLNDQQGPHLTLGSGSAEFGLYQIGFENAFIQLNRGDFELKLGKFSFPFLKQNELFWNDNVFPEGISLAYTKIFVPDHFFNNIGFSAAHFVILSSNEKLKNDSYLQAIQFHTSLFNQRINIYSGLFHFENLNLFPDSEQTGPLDYSILNLGNSIIFHEKTQARIGFDLYRNFSDYANLTLISDELREEKQGFTFSAGLGKLETKGDILLELYYAYLERFSIVDFFAQNDWGRWDYSNLGLAGSRLSNFKGFELRAGYAVAKNQKLILRFYAIEQLVPYGSFKENGKRIRLDFDVSF